MEEGGRRKEDRGRVEGDGCRVRGRKIVRKSDDRAG